jgi:hypothetical protein
MDLAKGLKLEQGTTIILTDDQYVSALQPKFGVHMDRLKFLSPWSDFQSYVSFNDENLFNQESGQYVSQGNLTIKINFTNKKLLDVNSKTTFRIVNIIEVKGIKIITITGIIITQALTDRFVSAYWVSVGPDVFKLLAKNVKPRDVVRLCGTNQKLRAWCNDNFYAEMLQHHFNQKSPTPGTTFRDLTKPIPRYRASRDVAPYAHLPILEDNDIFVSLSSNYNFVALLTKNGNVWVQSNRRADNRYGIFGNYVTNDEYVMVESLKNIVKVELTNERGVFLDKFGVLWGSGLNYTTYYVNNEFVNDKFVYDKFYFIQTKTLVEEYRRESRIHEREFDPIIIDRNVHTFHSFESGDDDIILLGASYSKGFWITGVGIYTNGVGFICGVGDSREKNRFNIQKIEAIKPKPSNSVKPIGYMIDCILTYFCIMYLDKAGFVWIQESRSIKAHDDFSYFLQSSELFWIKMPFKVTSIAYSNRKFWYLDTNGNVWTTDVDILDSKYEGITEPTKIEGLSNIKLMSIDSRYQAFIDRNGSLWYMTEGQIVQIPNVTDATFVQIHDKDIISFIA